MSHWIVWASRYTILRYDPTLPEGSQLERLAGQSGQRWFRDGRGSDEALLGDVAGLTTDTHDTIYFCDYAHGAVRAISPDGFVYTLVCADPQYTNVAFSFAAPFGIHFDRWAAAKGQPRLFVTDFHRVLQVNLDPVSFPVPGQPNSGRRMVVSPLGVSAPTPRTLAAEANHSMHGNVPHVIGQTSHATSLLAHHDGHGKATASILAVGRKTPPGSARGRASDSGRSSKSGRAGGVKVKPEEKAAVLEAAAGSETAEKPRHSFSSCVVA